MMRLSLNTTDRDLPLDGNHFIHFNKTLAHVCSLKVIADQVAFILKLPKT
jgi:hypothetical protein